ncbi:MAG: hypothetical protein ACM3X6_07300 [Patescibacteria group bacterium]
MRRLWCVLVLSLVTVLPIIAEEGFDLRKIRWGMSMAEVRAAEGREPVYQDEESMMYKGISMVNHDFDLAYYFNDDRLYQAIYAWADTSFGANECFIVYGDLKDLLNAKYGTSDRDDRLWKSDLFRDDPNDWEMAVAAGSLVCYASWETERTEITLMLAGKNYKLLLLVGYKSKEMQDEVEQDDLEKDLANL